MSLDTTQTDGPPPIDLTDPFKGLGKTWKAKDGTHHLPEYMSDRHLLYSLRIIYTKFRTSIRKIKADAASRRGGAFSNNHYVRLGSGTSQESVLFSHLYSQCASEFTTHRYLKTANFAPLYGGICSELEDRGYLEAELVLFISSENPHDTATARKAQETPSGNEPAVQDSAEAPSLDVGLDVGSESL